MMVWTLLADGLVAALLIAAIVVGIRLDRRLDVLRSGRAEMAALIKALNAACERADLSVAQLRAAVKEGEDTLNQPLGSARALRDELSIMIESGDRLASRLEQAASNTRVLTPRTGVRTEAARETVTTGEAPLLKALKGLR
ncbi:hypothetical protein E6W36_14615 [Hankyongella ginsenosidimutans]|uniref:Pterin-binding domain-containing protein n=2 Tax=Hankyongella ginsenosidimutans TaxID=1763828 RepID=A0A4D7BY60_9SPHN|nr:hypothetical protein E6W36_14615 [Hankyongella ginsenosidimutans]TXG83353.1 MAG: hypothetical protein E6R12_08180 [Sphingomonadales bacterium]